MEHRFCRLCCDELAALDELLGSGHKPAYWSSDVSAGPDATCDACGVSGQHTMVYVVTRED